VTKPANRMVKKPILYTDCIAPSFKLAYVRAIVSLSFSTFSADTEHGN